MWLSNYTDSRDDMWLGVWARIPAEALEKVYKECKYNPIRYHPGRVYSIKEFRKLYGDLPV